MLMHVMLIAYMNDILVLLIFLLFKQVPKTDILDLVGNNFLF